MTCGSKLPAAAWATSLRVPPLCCAWKAEEPDAEVPGSEEEPEPEEEHAAVVRAKATVAAASAPRPALRYMTGNSRDQSVESRNSPTTRR